MSRPRIVITGLGVVAPGAGNVSELTALLRQGRSAITRCAEAAEQGLAVPGSGDALRGRAAGRADHPAAPTARHEPAHGLGRPGSRRMLAGRRIPLHGRRRTRRRPRHGRDLRDGIRRDRYALRDRRPDGCRPPEPPAGRQARGADHVQRPGGLCVRPDRGRRPCHLAAPPAPPAPPAWFRRSACCVWGSAIASSPAPSTLPAFTSAPSSTPCGCSCATATTIPSGLGLWAPCTPAAPYRLAARALLLETLEERHAAAAHASTPNLPAASRTAEAGGDRRYDDPPEPRRSRALHPRGTRRRASRAGRD